MFRDNLLYFWGEVRSTSNVGPICSVVNWIHYTLTDKQSIYKAYIKTSLGTQRCPGYLKLLPPFTSNWSLIMNPNVSSIKVDLFNLFWKPCQEHSRGFPKFTNQMRQIGHRVHELWSYIQTNKEITTLYTGCPTTCCIVL